MSKMNTSDKVFFGSIAGYIVAQILNFVFFEGRHSMFAVGCLIFVQLAYLGRKQMFPKRYETKDQE